MEVAAASTLQRVALLSTSTIQRHKSANPIWPSSKPYFLCIHPSKDFPRPRNNPFISITHCSAKPNTNTNNETDPNYTSRSTPSPDQDSPNPTVKSSTFSSSSPSPALTRGLVLGLGTTGSWDSQEVGSPVVKRFLSDEEERWYMWYHGSNSGDTDSIGLAVSSNGVHWERGVGPAGDVGLVMKRGSDWWSFDTMTIRPSEVVIMSSAKVRASSAVYWLYYTGFSAEEVEVEKDGSFGLSFGGNPERFSLYNNGRVFKSLPGLAISQDGRHWARIEGEHHSGALFDVGSEGEWDSLFVASPQVVFHENGDLRMYYHSFDGGKGEFGIGVARSRDGIKWVKLGKVIGGGGKSGSFDELGGLNACVVKNKKGGNLMYLMAYEGVGADGKRSIGLAVSSDGLKDWKRIQNEAVLKPCDGEGWDNKGVGSPSLVQMDGDVDEWRLYYSGVGDEGRTGIGMAISRGSEFTCFTRWTGFQL